MRYLLATGKGSVALEECEASELPNDHVRIQVAYVGICHSDTALVAEGQGTFPTRLGHEVSGTVIESKTPSLPVGTRVAAYVVDGYANQLLVPINRIVSLHDDCSLLDGALSEPLACVVGAMDMLDLSTAPEVVVVGAGFMGLMALRLLVARGHKVVVIEPREACRDLAVKWGAAHVLHPDEVPVQMKLTKHIVVEATGSPGGLELASSLVQIAGTLGVLGYHQSNGGKRMVDMESWNYRALRVLSLHHRDPADVMLWMDRAQRLSALGIVVPSQLVDASVNLEKLPAIFEVKGQHRGIKAVLDLTSF